MKPTTLVRAYRTAAMYLALIATLAITAPPGHADQLSFGPNQLCANDPLRPDRDAAIRPQIAEGRNGPIGYVRFGHGTPILLITGYRATLGEWNARFLGELARNHDVIAFDNRGVGASVPNDGSIPADYSIEDMANDAADLITALKLQRVNVVGWSMGGMIAQQLALSAPQKVESLTLISTAPPGPSARPVAPAVEATLSGSGPDVFARIMGVLFPAGAVDDAMQCFRAQMFEPHGYQAVRVPNAVAAQQSAAMQGWFADSAAAHALSRLPVRTLIIDGAQDSVLSPDNGRRLEQMIPRATLDVVADAGHALMFQYPVQLAKRVGAFIAE
jgi:pimeloyl-ACP methyl ester carboxylesterase